MFVAPSSRRGRTSTRRARRCSRCSSRSPRSRSATEELERAKDAVAQRLGSPLHQPGNGGRRAVGGHRAGRLAPVLPGARPRARAEAGRRAARRRRPTCGRPTACSAPTCRPSSRCARRRRPSRRRGGRAEGLQGRPAVAQAAAFDPTPANIDARTQRFTLASGMKVALLPKGSRGAGRAGGADAALRRREGACSAAATCPSSRRAARPRHRQARPPADPGSFRGAQRAGAVRRRRHSATVSIGRPRQAARGHRAGRRGAARGELPGRCARGSAPADADARSSRARKEPEALVGNARRSPWQPLPARRRAPCAQLRRTGRRPEGGDARPGARLPRPLLWRDERAVRCQRRHGRGGRCSGAGGRVRRLEAGASELHPRAAAAASR